jgi:localization factor PodJL
MKSGVPWNVKGVPPQVRDSARKAARLSGMSVAEWLNNAILDRAAEDGIPVPDFQDEEDIEPVRQQSPAPDTRPDNSIAEALAKSIDRIDRRLDDLLAQNQSLKAPQPGPPLPQPPAYAPPPYAPPAYAMPVAYAPPSYRAPAPDPWAASLDQAIAEIASRQRALDSGIAAATPQQRPMQPQMPPRQDFAPQPESRERPAQEPRFPQQDISGLEQQLQRITTQIENLHRPNGLEEAVRGLREDLTEIGRALQEALPRRAVDALEADMRRLADRIDQGRQCGLDPATLAGMERGLAEVRDALRTLTPAESLAGFEEAVRDLARKIDQMGSGGLDIRTLQQLETAIGGLRGVASHIASNDSLTKLADEIRGLSAKIDRVAVNAAGAGADVMSGMEERIGALTEQLRTMSGRPSLPPRIEEILTRFADRAEQEPALSNGDQLALRNLEDRIVDLSAKLDASDARLGSLSAIERGFADLLVHLDEMRSGADRRAAPDPAILDLKRDMARTHESLEAVHGALSAVVDRLATIETDRRSEPKAPPAFAVPEMRAAAPHSPLDLRATSSPMPIAAPSMPHVASAPSLAPAIEKPQPPRPAAEAGPRPKAAPEGTAQPAKTMPPASRDRRPIDPNLPPDHPIEPGAGLPRPPVTAAERIAASEAALGPARGTAGGASSTNFIAAARRAAMAAGTPTAGTPSPAAASDEQPVKASKPLAERVRALLVAASVVVIVVGAFQLAINYFESESSSPEIPASSTTRPDTGPLGDKAPAPGNDRRSGLAPAAPAASQTPVDSDGETDATGSIASQTQAARSTPEQPMENFDQRAALSEKLPAPLRNAAANGDPAAAYEVAMRHLDGRGVPQNLREAARWLDRAASAGLAPAQFRLGSLYEKGQGVKKNIDAAHKLYLAAAEKGNAKAMHNLAVLYAEGAYGKPDYKQASQWFRKAAERGVADSQYNLGVLYARGIGVEQNLAESFKWFSLSAAQGDKDSAKKRDEVAAKLDPQSLVTARLAIQTFVPQPQPEEATTVRSPEGGWERPAASPAPARTPKKPRTVDPMRLSPT